MLYLVAQLYLDENRPCADKILIPRCQHLSARIKSVIDKISSDTSDLTDKLHNAAVGNVRLHLLLCNEGIQLLGSCQVFGLMEDL